VDDGHVCVFIMATYTDGQSTDDAAWFMKWLGEAVRDFRVQKMMLNGMNYAVFGLGNSLYEENYNKVARNVDEWLGLLSAKRVISVGLGDNNVVASIHGGIDKDFSAWKDELLTTILQPESKKIHKDIVSVQCSDEKQNEEIVENGSNTEDEGEQSDREDKQTDSVEGLVDLEDMGDIMDQMKRKKANRVENGEKNADNSVAIREMITPALRQSLSKQGYRLIGSHSGVKMCRWTKSMLRGRGGCYKHTFYGIESHRCMETTPSLACANKCVFCWRHHTNPVGTEWRWKVDSPSAILDGALNNHYQMIKQFRGVPGVKTDRFEDAMTAKHCALSLVGEPIMYPRINELITLLHSKQISTFLVTNAQFPDAIKNLSPVTQLYVSVDASTKDSLKRIDRPLFKDYWDRFLDSLSALAEKGQRTVFRLTLVKAWNTDELEAYAELVSRGKPDFIEVKGVTYCGDSKASSLTMNNVPWHEEVVLFVQKLADLLPDYDIACEHEHSNCVLIAHKRLYIDGHWHTWIDYSKFHELLSEYEGSSGKKMFTTTDYVARTPAWAVFGDLHRGFDPVETRWQRKRKDKGVLVQ
jgi:tRNA wybutosine-synthesizing protein 1